jgi:outer membrane lipoprotein-sorting protein
MTRRLAACLAILALVVGACSNTAPALTDPKDIVAQSLTTVQAMKSFHLHATLSGSLKVDILGTGNPVPVDLQGTTADADVDVTNKKLKGSLNAPALFITGDLIYVGTDAYVKAGLLGPKYMKFSLGDILTMIPGASPGASPAASAALPSVDPSAAIQSIKDGLGKLTVPPVKNADEKIGDQDCYKVTITLSQADVAGVAPSLPPAAGDATFNATVEVWVRKNDLRPAQVAITGTSGTDTNVKLTMTISNIDTPVTIDAPPADQVAPSS